MSLRTSLQRLARLDPAAPSLRERLASATARLSDTKDRAGRAAKAAKILMKAPEPAPEPPNRVVLVNYATWLWHERRRVCGELYPHLGTRADAFVLGLNAAEDWHFNGRDRRGGWAERPPATPRAIEVLDMVGVDWRADVERGGLSHVDTSNLQDTGERPVLPYGWPAPDAALIEALDDLTRLDAAQNAMFGTDSDRSGDKVPGYHALEKARTETLDRLAGTKAESLIGLQAKAKALFTPAVIDAPDDFADIAEGLARDLIGGSQAITEPKADPIFTVITEGRRLLQASLVADTIPDIGLNPHPDCLNAQHATWDHFRGPLMQTVPTTARGCVELARFAAEFQAAQEADDIGDALLTILALIARSPLL